VTITNPKPLYRRMGKKNYLTCHSCFRPFSADGRGERLYCNPCRKMKALALRERVLAAQKLIRDRESAFRNLWKLIDYERCQIC
jgi:hypothetical protein